MIPSTSTSGHTLERELTILPEYNPAAVFTSLRENQTESAESNVQNNIFPTHVFYI